LEIEVTEVVLEVEEEIIEEETGEVILVMDLEETIHFHLFRHSSATYYATKLNRQELCYRYGWKFSSDMPDVYISRAGMQNKELDEKFSSTELEELQTKLEKQEQQRMIEVEEMKKEKEQLQKRMELDFSEMKKKLEKEFWKDVELKMKKLIDQGLVVYKGD